MAEIHWERGVPGPVADAVALMEASGAPHLRRPHQVVGVSVGGCIEAVGSDRRGAFRRNAHAHTTGCTNVGWICFLSAKPERVITASGRPSRLFWHEWAHIAANTGHTARFRKLLLGVGQPAAIIV